MKNPTFRVMGFADHGELGIEVETVFHRQMEFAEETFTFFDSLKKFDGVFLVEVSGKNWVVTNSKNADNHKVTLDGMYRIERL